MARKAPRKTAPRRKAAGAHKTVRLPNVRTSRRVHNYVKDNWTVSGGETGPRRVRGRARPHTLPRKEVKYTRRPKGRKREPVAPPPKSGSELSYYRQVEFHNNTGGPPPTLHPREVRARARMEREMGRRARLPNVRVRDNPGQPIGPRRRVAPTLVGGLTQGQATTVAQLNDLEARAQAMDRNQTIAF